MTGALGELQIFALAVGVPGEPLHEITGTREAVFNHTRSDDHGRYRPLSGARTLPTGWSAPLGTGLSAEEAVEAVYPLALVHQRQFAEGTLRVVPLEDVLTRQSGRYEAGASLSEAGRRLAVSTICGECVRKPVWADASCSHEEIPCPEACSVFVAFCREAAQWETGRPASAEPDATIAWAAFDQPGNELREHFLKEMDQPR